MLSEASEKLLAETDKFLRPRDSRALSIDANGMELKENSLLHNMRSRMTNRKRSKSLLPTQSPTYTHVAKKRTSSSQLHIQAEYLSESSRRSQSQKTLPSGYERKSFCSYFEPEVHSDATLIVKTFDKSINADIPLNPLSTADVTDLHAEIEKLQQDNTTLLQSKIEVQNLKKKQEILERSISVMQKQMKLLRIGHPDGKQIKRSKENSSYYDK